MAAVPANTVLSAVHQSAVSAGMPLHSNMQRVCPPGIDKTWSYKRIMARYTATAEMPSLGRSWLRPCALKEKLPKYSTSKIFIRFIKFTFFTQLIQFTNRINNKNQDNEKEFY